MNFSEKIFVVDFTGGLKPVDFSPIEFFATHANAETCGLTVQDYMKNAMAEFAARRKGIIVDFPS